MGIPVGPLLTFNSLAHPSLMPKLPNHSQGSPERTLFLRTAQFGVLVLRTSGDLFPGVSRTDSMHEVAPPPYLPPLPNPPPNPPNPPPYPPPPPPTSPPYLRLASLDRRLASLDAGANPRTPLK